MVVLARRVVMESGAGRVSSNGLVYRDNVELIFLLSGSRQPDHFYTKPWRR